jgi:hypothetical protein
MTCKCIKCPYIDEEGIEDCVIDGVCPKDLEHDK